MIAAARNERLGSFLQARHGASRLVRRFVGGRTLEGAIDTCRRLLEAGRRASLYYLGEYLSDPVAVRSTVERKQAAAAALGAAGLDVHVSVDPTQIGLQLSPETLRDHAVDVARAVASAAQGRSGPGVDLLMLDMEDDSVVDATISLYRELEDRGLPVGLTLQAYLRRTADDLAALLGAPRRIRLVKGAFAAPGRIAFTSRRRIDASYRRLAAALLSGESRSAGLYPIFATHDEAMIADLLGVARSIGWGREELELEMLYGVRPDLQRRLVEEGHRVRIYVPFGEDWWPYAARRLGESPRNLGLLLAALAPRRGSSGGSSGG